MNYEQNESETKIPAIYIITAVNFAIIIFVARKYLIATKKRNVTNSSKFNLLKHCEIIYYNVY